MHRCRPAPQWTFAFPPRPTGSGFVSQPEDQWGWFDSIAFTIATSTFLRSVAADVVKAYALLEASPASISWYFIRAPFLADGPAVTKGAALGTLRLGYANNGAGSPASSLTRADTAQLMLDFATKPERVTEWVRKSPVATL